MQTIIADFSTTQGTIKPLHGINNGPWNYYGFMNTTQEYGAAGIPYVRLHDCNMPRTDRVDIPQVFPDFDADPEDAASYRFALTDDVIKAVVDCGAAPFYRLGTSIEHERIKKYIYPPKDHVKWAEICAGIIRHYTQGWANGFHYDIPYWEIWNEPDLTPEMWLGTPQQYFDLYTTAAPLLKKWFPGLKIGGCGICSVWNREFINGFLGEVKRTGAPLDYFSWHWYGDSPELLRDTARQVKADLAAHGFTEAESICNEWNYMRGNMWVPARRDKYIRQEFYEKQKNHFGASFIAACMTVLHQEGVNLSTHYDGQPQIHFCSIFDRYGIETKAYYTFVAYNKLYRMGQAAQIETPQGVYGMAAKGEAGAAAMVANFTAPGEVYALRLTGLTSGTVRLRMVDEHRTMTPVLEKAFTGDLELELVLLQNSMLLIEMDP